MRRISDSAPLYALIIVGLLLAAVVIAGRLLWGVL